MGMVQFFIRELSFRWSQQHALLPRLDGISFTHPIRSEIVRDEQDLQVAEAHPAQEFVCGLHIGAMVPGTAPAVEHDGFVPRQFLNSFPELPHPFR